MVVIENLNCQPIVHNYIVLPEAMHSVRLQLEADTISYLSLIPDHMFTSHSSNVDFNHYMGEAYAEVNVIL